jgi:hypothetical protein
MNAFEELIGDLLQTDGYWVIQNYRVEFTREQKHEIGRPSQPSWELDLLAYRPRDSEILIVECKSFLDSGGVTIKEFAETDKSTKSRYKLFNERVLRRVLMTQLTAQLKSRGYISTDPKIVLALVAGRIKNADEKRQLISYFNERNWRLFDEEWIKQQLERVSSSVYSDRVSSMVAKLLLK